MLFFFRRIYTLILLLSKSSGDVFFFELHNFFKVSPIPPLRVRKIAKEVERATSSKLAKQYSVFKHLHLSIFHRIFSE